MEVIGDVVARFCASELILKAHLGVLAPGGNVLRLLLCGAVLGGVVLFLNERDGLLWIHAPTEVPVPPALELLANKL